MINGAIIVINASMRLWSVVCGTIVVEAAIASMSKSKTELDDPAAILIYLFHFMKLL